SGSQLPDGAVRSKSSPFMSPHPSPREGPSSLRWRMPDHRGVRSGQHDAEHRTEARRAAHFDAATHELDQLSRNEQTQATALDLLDGLVRTTERLEELQALLLGQADARVVN